MRITPDGVASYGGAAASMAAGLTLQDYGVLVGIFTALVTCCAHIYFSSRRAELEDRVASARIAEMQSHTSQGSSVGSAEAPEPDGGDNG
jgi:hypothetical protein